MFEIYSFKIPLLLPVLYCDVFVVSLYSEETLYKRVVNVPSAALMQYMIFTVWRRHITKCRQIRYCFSNMYFKHCLYANNRCQIVCILYVRHSSSNFYRLLHFTNLQIVRLNYITLHDFMSHVDVINWWILFIGWIGARMAVRPPPLMRMMCAPVPPPYAPPPRLVVYGDQQLSAPRPTAAPFPLAAGQVHAAAFNVPPPRRFPRWFLFVCLSCFVYYVMLFAHVEQK